MEFTALFVILVMSVFGIFPVRAQQPEPEQPVEEVFQSELVYPQERGEVQLALAPWLAVSTENRTGQSPLVVEYGLTNAWQLEAEWSGPGYGAERELGMLELGTKYSFMNIRDAGFHVALGSEIEIPMENDDEGVEVQSFLILAKDFPRLAHLHVFTQAAIGFEPSTGSNDLYAEEEEEGIAWSFHLGAILPTDHIHGTAEFSWLRTDERTHTYATPGVVWDLPGNWQVGLGLPLGLTDASDRFRVVGLLSYAFELFHDE